MTTGTAPFAPPTPPGDHTRALEVVTLHALHTATLEVTLALYQESGGERGGERGGGRGGERGGERGGGRGEERGGGRGEERGGEVEERGRERRKETD